MFFFFGARVSKVGHVKYMDHWGCRLHPGCAQPMIVLHFPHGKCTRGILKQIQEGGWFLGHFSGKTSGIEDDWSGRWQSGNGWRINQHLNTIDARCIRFYGLEEPHTTQNGGCPKMTEAKGSWAWLTWYFRSKLVDSYAKKEGDLWAHYLENGISNCWWCCFWFPHRNLGSIPYIELSYKNWTLKLVPMFWLVFSWFQRHSTMRHLPGPGMGDTKAIRQHTRATGATLSLCPCMFITSVYYIRHTYIYSYYIIMYTYIYIYTLYNT